MSLTINSLTVPASNAGGAKYIAIAGRAKRNVLILTNETEANSGARLFYGFEPPETAGVEDFTNGTFKGTPLDPGLTIALGGADIDVAGPLYLTCPAGGGTTAYYTDKA